MFIRKEILERIAIEGNRLGAHADSLHLSSIAKAIEYQRGCQIFIEPFDEKGPDAECTGCLATCEPCIIRDVGKPPLKEFKCLNIRHHFIFYRPCPEDIEIEKFRIAHELGHCALHWPLGPREDRLFKGSYNDLYMVRFLKSEEEEADAFACLLTAHRPTPPRSITLEINDFLFEKITSYESKGLLRSMRA